MSFALSQDIGVRLESCSGEEGGVRKIPRIVFNNLLTAPKQMVLKQLLKRMLVKPKIRVKTRINVKPKIRVKTRISVKPKFSVKTRFSVKPKISEKTRISVKTRISEKTMISVKTRITSGAVTNGATARADLQVGLLLAAARAPEKLTADFQ